MSNTVFIPGGTSGLGLGLALRWQAAGNSVIVGGRRTELLEKIAAENPGIRTVEIDVTDPNSIQAAAQALPDVDVLVTMSGIMEPETLAEVTALPAALDVSERTIEVNLLGTIRLVHAFLPSLLAKPRARIVTVSSGLAFVPLPATPTYSATKSAVHAWTQALRVQLSGTPVAVTELVPPAVRTTLMHQEESEIAMPLEEFLDESFALLTADPEAAEVLVERVKWQRNADREGRYDEVFDVLSGRHRS